MESSMATATSPGRDILVVEDNDDTRELYCAILRRNGYNVREADNGESALEVLRELADDPCLVLLDLMMPVMSGPELLRILHDNERLARVPVVVLSAGGKPSDAPGAQKFVRKPVQPDVLLAVVREFCSGPEPC
jgi:CheY-like chemotaxis protein